MKREMVDFFLVPDHQLAIHLRLENWSRYDKGRSCAWSQAPIWKLGKSNGRQWHTPELRPSVDTLDGHAIEKAVGSLPAPHRDAIRWYYVFAILNPSRMRRHLGVTDRGLGELVADGRRMLINRKV